MPIWSKSNLKYIQAKQKLRIYKTLIRPVIKSGSKCDMLICNHASTTTSYFPVFTVKYNTVVLIYIIIYIQMKLNLSLFVIFVIFNSPYNEVGSGFLGLEKAVKCEVYIFKIPPHNQYEGSEHATDNWGHWEISARLCPMPEIYFAECLPCLDIRQLVDKWNHY